MTGPARCQVCSQPLAERVVSCARCETPHHAECFEYTGQCSTFGCGSRAASALHVQPAVEETVTWVLDKELEGELALEIDRARTALAAGDGKGCRMVLEKALAQCPAEGPAGAEAWAVLGEALGLLGQREDALTAAERALELDRTHAHAWYVGGTSAFALGRDERARASAEKAVALAPDRPVAWTLLGCTLLVDGRFEDALKKFDEALRLGDPRPVCTLNRAIALQRLGRHEEALQSLARIEPVLPSLTERSRYVFWYRRALCEVGLERLADALKSLERALEVRPGDPEALTIRAVTLDRMKPRASKEIAPAPPPQVPHAEARPVDGPLIEAAIAALALWFVTGNPALGLVAFLGLAVWNLSR